MWWWWWVVVVVVVVVAVVVMMHGCGGSDVGCGGGGCYLLLHHRLQNYRRRDNQDLGESYINHLSNHQLCFITKTIANFHQTSIFFLSVPRAYCSFRHRKQTCYRPHNHQLTRETTKTSTQYCIYYRVTKSHPVGYSRFPQ